MKKRNLLVLFISLLAIFAFTSCKKECKHEFSDATCTSPKVCKLCDKKEGEALGHTYENGICTRCQAMDEKQSAAIINTAAQRTDEAGYTLVQTQKSIVKIEGMPNTEAVSKITLKFDGTNLYMEIESSAVGETLSIEIYAKQVGDKYIAYQLDNNVWVKAGESTIEELMGNTNPVTATNDMFKLVNGVWVGEPEKINAALADYLISLTSQYGMTNFSFSKYNITLKDNYMHKIDMTISASMTIETITMHMTLDTSVVYSEIGTTKNIEPTGLPTE